MNLVKQLENPTVLSRRSRRLLRTRLAGLALVAAATVDPLLAVNSTWVPTSGTQTWFSPTNWSPSQPTAIDTAVIGTSSNALVEGATVATAASLTINAGAVTIGDFAAGTLNVGGQVNIVGGRLNLSLGSLSLNSLVVGSAGTYSDTKFGTLRLTGAGAGIQLSSVNMVVNSLVTGTTGLSLTGPGTLVFANDNTYSGGTAISSVSTLLVGNNGAAGSLGGGTVVNAGVLAFGRTDTTVVANLITGTGSVRQLGSGTTTLTADNTYTGGTTISAGTLQVGNGGTTGSLGAGNVTDNGTLAFNRSDDVVVGNLISGAGNLTQAGNGKLTLTANNTYTGITTVSSGILQVGNGGTTGSLGTGGVNLSGSASTLVFNRSDAVVASGQIVGAGGLTQAGSGTLTLLGSNSYGGQTVISSGTLQVGNGGNAGTLGAGTVINQGSLVLNRSDNLLVSNTIIGTGSVVQAGGGTVALAGNNTYSGPTTILNGTLQVGNGGGTGSLGTGAVSNGGTLAFARGDALVVGNLISGIGSVRQIGGGITTLTADNTYTGGTTISAGTLQVGDGGTTGSLGFGAVTDNGTLIFNRSDDIVIGNAITGTGNLGQSGTGRLTVISNNTLTGNTVINAGTLQVGNGGASGSLGTGNISINNNGALIFNRSDTLVVGGQIVGVGGLTQAGSGTLVLAGGNGYGGTTVIASGTVQVGNGGVTGSLGTGNVLNSGALVFNHSDNILVSNLISGTGSVAQLGGGTVALTNNNTYTGATTITGGTLQIGNGGTAGSLGTAGVTNNGSLAFARSDNVIVSNPISGTGSVQQLGGGTVALTGDNTYSGGTTISNGTLQVGNNGTTGSLGSGGIVDNSRLLFNRTDTLSVPGAISGTGSVTQGGSGTVILTGDNSYTGTTTISGGTLQVGNGGTTGSLGTGAVTNAGTLVLNRSDALAIPGAITGTGSLRQVGAGKVTLTGANTYTGGTVINAGILQVGNGGTDGSLGAGGITNNASLVFNRSDALAVESVIDGSGNLRHSGAGTLSLSATNTYFGGTVVDGGGTLRVTNASALGRGDFTLTNGVLKVDSTGATRTKVAVGGNYVQSAGTVLDLTVAGTGANDFDSVAVAGRATLNGTLRLTAVGAGRPVHNTKLTLLSATGGVTGRFSSFVQSFSYSPLLNPQLGYNPNDVTLTWAHESFVPYAETRNQTAVAGALDSLLPSTAAGDVSLIDHLDYDFIGNLKPGLRGAFDQISPDGLTSMFSTAFAVLDIQGDSFLKRAGELLEDYPAIYSAALRDRAASTELFDEYVNNPWSTHFELPFSSAEVDATALSRGYKLKTRGLTFGLDRKLKDSFFVGLSGAYTNSTADVTDGSKVDTRSFGVDAYGIWFKQGFHLLGLIGATSNSFDTKRVTLGGVAAGSANGVSWTGLGGAGYDWQSGPWKVGGEATFQYMSANIDALTESGSLAPLRLLSQTASALYSQVGLNLRYRHRVQQWVIVTPQGYFGVRHDFKSDALSLDAQSASGAGNTFTVFGPKLGADSMVGSAGVSIQWRPAVNTSINYTRQIGRSGYDSNNLQFSARLSF